MKNLIEKIKYSHPHVLVVGDLMLDAYIYGKTRRISPEAPVPIVSIENKTMLPGGAANVMANLKALNCEVTGAGFIGNDDEGSYLHELLSKLSINIESIITCDLRTIHKNRIIANGQHIIRYDYDTDFSQTHHTGELIEYVEALACSRHYDVVVVSDYCKGTITGPLMESIKKSFKCPILCDSKPGHKDFFNGVWCITPNLSEAQEMLGYSTQIVDSSMVARKLKKQLNLTCIVLTLSDEGILLIDENNNELHLSAYTNFDEHDPYQRFDVTGAGDTVLSVLAASIAGGVSTSDAMYMANIAAGIVVKKTGTASCSFEELKNELNKLN